MKSLKRISFEHHERLGDTHSCGGALDVFHYRQTDVWRTFLGIKIYKLFSYKITPVGYHWDYPLPSTDKEYSLKAFRDGYQTSKIKYK